MLTMCNSKVRIKGDLRVESKKKSPLWSSLLLKNEDQTEDKSQKQGKSPLRSSLLLKSEDQTEDEQGLRLIRFLFLEFHRLIIGFLLVHARKRRHNGCNILGGHSLFAEHFYELISFDRA